jgi:hypothetical protein
MKIMPSVLFALMLGIVSATVLAAECTSSFYCYGNTANSVVRVATRPPPIPPPNQHVVQQRRQAQLALRNSPTPRIRITRPTVTPAPQQRVAPPLARPTPRALVQVAPPPARPTPRALVRVAPVPPPNRMAGNCQNLILQANGLESQAVIASQHNDRQRSVSLFRETANLRSQAARMNCR